MKNQTGFTLIEVIIYLALFAIFMGGMVAVSFMLFESAGRNQTRAMLVEEGEFLLGKIEWALSGVQSVDSPPVGVASSILQVSKWDGSLGNPWIVDLDPDSFDMRLCRPLCSAESLLNNDNVTLSNLSFTHAYAGGVNPESVIASFTLTANTPTGQSMTQDFSAVKYLRK